MEGSPVAWRWSARLQSRYGLADAVVVPPPADPEGIALALGMAVGAYVSDRLKPGMTVGIGWGRTLRCSIRAMRRRHVPRLTVVSLIGRLGRASELNTYETASHFAELHDATCYYLAAPTFANSVKPGTCSWTRPACGRSTTAAAAPI